MTTMTKDQCAREAMEPHMERAVPIEGWVWEADRAAGSWCWTKGPLVVYATPWWEGTGGISINLEVYGEPQSGYENGFEIRVAMPTLDEKVQAPMPERAVVMGIIWYLNAMTAFFKSTVDFYGEG